MLSSSSTPPVPASYRDDAYDGHLATIRDRFGVAPAERRYRDNRLRTPVIYYPTSYMLMNGGTGNPRRGPSKTPVAPGSS